MSIDKSDSNSEQHTDEAPIREDELSAHINRLAEPTNTEHNLNKVIL